MPGDTLRAARACPSAAAPEPCFHCGEAVPPGAPWRAPVAGAERAFCCAGCQAIAQTIAGAGLEAFYATRDGPSARPPGEGTPWQVYDDPAVQAGLTREVAPGLAETVFDIEGITCAACVWLLEHRVGALPGVSAFSVNYATRRGHAVWAPARARLSEVLGAVEAVGYRPVPGLHASGERRRLRERRRALTRLAVAGLGMMQVMMYAVPAYITADGLTAGQEALLRWASLVLTLPVLLYSAAPFFAGAWRDLTARTLGMDVPVALGLAAGFLGSVHATVTGGGHVYYDSVNMFVFLLLGSRYLEMVARHAAAGVQESLARTLPVSCVRLPDYPSPSPAQVVPLAGLAAGEVVRVGRGEVVPVDGSVLEGTAELDEGVLTGESRSARRGPGEDVVAGSVNRGEPLVVRALRVGAATRLAQIVGLLERALAEKPRVARLADRAASVFVVGLVVAAAAVALWWAGHDPGRALPIAIAVLVVSCPCALSLATPIALAVGTSRLARQGALVTRGHALETLARVTHVVFDKTGTLTTGRARLVDVLPLGAASRAECLRLASALEQRAEHPIARALRAVWPTTEPLAAREVPGEGVEAEHEARPLRLGRPEWVGALHGQPLPDRLDALVDGRTVVALGDTRCWLALLTFEDEERPGTQALLRRLRTLGVEVSMLSGDRPEVVAHWSRRLGIGTAEAAASPEAKRERVAALQARGAVVAMVGDGINDGPVLAQAQVSVVVSGATAVARAAADLALVREDLGLLAEAIDVARRTRGVIRQNLAWALAYNALAIPLAAAGWVTPLAAGIGMSLSSALVVANAMRLMPRVPGRAPRALGAPQPRAG